MYGHGADIAAILNEWKVNAFKEIRGTMPGHDAPCNLPDDDGPCLTHGTVLCHQAPIEHLPNTDPESEPAS